MKCGDPVLVYNKARGGRIFRHFSLASKTFKAMAQTRFDCGKCLHCRKKDAHELACRCVLHASMHKRNCFLTLTYDESRPGYHNNFNPKDLKNFKTALRRRYPQKQIDIFRVHEYGANGKKHWHLVVFNHDFADKEVHTRKNGIPLYKSKTLSKLWKHGFASIGDVTEASAMYQAQYMEKDFKYGYVTSKKKSDSHHSGIGRPYFLKHYKQILTLGYIPINGRKLPLPRYFEKLAHKHYCHFNDRSAFGPTSTRKEALYSPFKEGEANEEISELFKEYKNQKDLKIEEWAEEFEAVISQHLTTGKDPDFLVSLQNSGHDLRNKQNKGAF